MPTHGVKNAEVGKILRKGLPVYTFNYSGGTQVRSDFSPTTACAACCSTQSVTADGLVVTTMAVKGAF